MNHSQRIVLFCAAFILLGIMLYPPFHFQTNQFEKNMGYSLIWNPPHYSERMESTINHKTLCAELFVVCVAGAVLFFAFGKTHNTVTPKRYKTRVENELAQEKFLEPPVS